MAKRSRMNKRTAAQATMSLRALMHRSAFFFFVFLSAALIVVSRTDPRFAPMVRGFANDMLAPVIGFLSHPVRYAQNAADGVRHFFDTYDENERLRSENAYLLYWQQLARQLEHENAELRRLMNMPNDQVFGVSTTAKVLGGTGGPFVRTLLVTGGTRDGLTTEHVALAPEGVVGRVIETGRATSRILLLTDATARLPVVVERNRARAVLAGDNGPQPRLNYLSIQDTVEKGDRLITSGDGGFYPPNLPVGVVASVEGRVVRVRLFADAERLEYLRLVKIDELADVNNVAGGASRAP